MIKEDFLHYLWKNKLLLYNDLEVFGGEKLQIISYGEVNPFSGPDFFNARLKIGNQEWAGNVEIHTKSSLWYAHGHETNSAYGNVILHVVWEHDIEVFDYQQNIIPTLELKNYVGEELLHRYLQLTRSTSQFIPCENQIVNVPKSILNAWIQKMYVERLEEKSERILARLKENNNDWEATFFELLMRNFGGNVNGEAFEKVAKNIPFSVIRKELYQTEQLEALLFGQLQLIGQENTDPYIAFLQKEYAYQAQKYQLKQTNISVQFFKLRPQNFPTIRVSQIACLYGQEISLFAKCLTLSSLDEFYKMISLVSTSPYWKNHYTFGKESAVKTKKISKVQAQILWINAIIPIQFSYKKSLGKISYQTFISKIKSIPSEENSILERFKKNGLKIENAYQSQALIQLYNKYCLPKKCLQCNIGNCLLR